MKTFLLVSLLAFSSTTYAQSSATSGRGGPSHASWTRGYGNYTFSVCSSGCDLVGAAGLTVPVKIEAWGGGAGGGGGEDAIGGRGGNGGGGGGGGGYATTTIMVTFPSTGKLLYYVQVGSGGPGGHIVDPRNYRDGGYGGHSFVRVNSSGGPLIVQANGGIPGTSGYVVPGWSGYGNGGAPGGGSINGWSGTAGYHGQNVSGCNGGAGGYGGAGGGPGRTGPGYINDGGNGGHGGYYHTGALSCNSHGMNYLLAEGAPGGGGKVVFSW